MLGFTEAADLRYRELAMDACISPFEYRDVDCSGRSLATLMVAWVGAAMVASVLLRWKYMWIALTILTLLFLFACGYAACNARRAHERAMANEEARIFERNRRDTRNIQSVSGSVEECTEANDPPAYQAYWITDLPPSYAVVIGAESLPPPPPPPIARSSDAEPPSPTNSKPPPYSEAIQADPCDVSEAASPPPLRAISNRVGESSSDPRNTSSDCDEPTNSQTPQVVPVSMLPWHEDVKIVNEQTRQGNSEAASSPNNSQTVLTTGTIYLSNIISCTFGRGQRRHNGQRNDSLQTTVTNSTSIRDRSAITQLNNQDTIPAPFRLNANTL